ncbi:MAG: helix-turn-helix domain-containing protein, partial [Actinobacteria bacterium]|nr:helix-turn-helix domain-containing protein [Actinomycetota bacterium]
NLITDMTIKGANNSELARAVKHSMVVIDAEKHKLNYKQSAKDNGIRALEKKYQESPDYGASTLLSRKKSEVDVPERKMMVKIDPDTGKKIYTETGDSYINKAGDVVVKKDSVKKIDLLDDANELSSGTPMEREYAKHSNQMKSLANEARKEMVATKNTPYSPSAKEAYSEEVTSLDAKLRIALRNAPRERQAQVVGNMVYRAKLDADPDMKSEDKKKIKAQALAEARVRTGANKDLVTITDNEWDAVQAGAISPSKLDDILRNSDLDEIKKLATPRDTRGMSRAKITRAKSMASLGYTQAEIASALGVSTTAVSEAIG